MSGRAALISYNYGAHKFDRAKSAFLWQFLLCVGYAVLFWLLLMLFPGFFAGAFTNDEALVSYAAWALRIYMACVFSTAFQTSCQHAFLALGEAKVSLFLACLRKFILLIPLIFILPPFFANKVMAVFLAAPVADVTAATVTTLMFFRFFRKLYRSEAQQ